MKGRQSLSWERVKRGDLGVFWEQQQHRKAAESWMKEGKKARKSTTSNKISEKGALTAFIVLQRTRNLCEHKKTRIQKERRETHFSQCSYSQKKSRKHLNRKGMMSLPSPKYLPLGFYESDQTEQSSRRRSLSENSSASHFFSFA